MSKQERQKGTPLGIGLHANGLKKADVNALAILSGDSRVAAAKKLLGIEIQGDKINTARGEGSNKKSRKKAALELLAKTLPTAD